jgi:hypothetical protein
MLTHGRLRSGSGHGSWGGRQHHRTGLAIIVRWMNPGGGSGPALDRRIVGRRRGTCGGTSVDAPTGGLHLRAVPVSYAWLRHALLPTVEPDTDPTRSILTACWRRDCFT